MTWVGSTPWQGAIAWGTDSDPLWNNSLFWDNTTLWGVVEDNSWDELAPWDETEVWDDHSVNLVNMSSSSSFGGAVVRSKVVSSAMTASSSLQTTISTQQLVQVALISVSKFFPTLWPHGFSTLSSQSVLTISLEKQHAGFVELVSTSLLSTLGVSRKVNYTLSLSAMSVFTVRFNRQQAITLQLTSSSQFNVVLNRRIDISSALTSQSIFSVNAIRMRNGLADLRAVSVLQAQIAKILLTQASFISNSMLNITGARAHLAIVSLTALSSISILAKRLVPVTVVMISNHTFLAVPNPLISMFNVSTLAVGAKQIQLTTVAMVLVSALLAGVRSTRAGIVVLTSRSELLSFYWTGKYVLVRDPSTGQLVPCIIRVRDAWFKPFVTPAVVVRKSLKDPWITVQEKVTA
jgi:hypothetical protein